MDCLSFAHVPAIEVSPSDTVLDVVALTLPAKMGAVVVVDAGRLVGIFTERDVMLKVVHGRRDPRKTRVGEVMTAPVITIPRFLSRQQAMTLMVKHRIRHLPISEDGKTVLGMLSIQNLLQHLVEDLSSDVRSMEEYIGAEAAGA
jgi:CBS domain-containing protein